MNSPSKNGFTLIELLVVIAIIGLLSAIVLASLNTARAKGRDAVRQSTLQSVQQALELYYDAHGSYPGSPTYICSNAYVAFSVWDTYGPPSFSTTGWGVAGFYTALVTGGYIPSLPDDPVNRESVSSPYAPNFLDDNAPADQSFLYASNGQGYILGTNLETKTGAASDCGNWEIKGGTPINCFCP